MRLTSLLILPAALFAGSFFACGGRVDDPGSGQPGPGSTGTIAPTGSPTGTPTSAPTSAPTGSPTGSPTGTATSEPVPPSPPECTRTNDRLVIVASGTHSGSCELAKPGGPAPAPVDFTGQIVKVGASFVEIDTCPPTADCMPSITTLSATAAGLDLSTLPVRSFVHVQATFTNFWGCHSTILVESIDDWYGTKNPIDKGGVTYFVGNEGGTTSSGAHFAIEPRANGCGTAAGSCGGTSLPTGDYTLEFHGDGPGEGSVSIPMGASARFVANGQILEARNLRSYNSGYCDAYWDWAYWAKASYGEK